MWNQCLLDNICTCFKGFNSNCCCNIWSTKFCLENRWNFYRSKAPYIIKCEEQFETSPTYNPTKKDEDRFDDLNRITFPCGKYSSSNKSLFSFIFFISFSCSTFICWMKLSINEYNEKRLLSIVTWSTDLIHAR